MGPHASDDRSRPSTSPLVVGAVAALIVAIVLGIRLGDHDGDPTRWSRVGEVFAKSEELPPDFFQEVGLGYDGQFFYRMARAPLSTDDRVDGIRFDRPTFRHARIGYPLLAWAGSMGGTRGAVPWALPAVNIAMSGLGAAAAGALFRSRGRSPWFGLAAAALPATLVAAYFNLAEATEAACLLGGLMLIQRRRFTLAALVITWAVLSRETALILPLALLGAKLLTPAPLARRWRLAEEATIPWRVVLVPLAVYAITQLMVSRAWPTGGGGTSESLGHARRPLQGWFDAVRTVGDRPTTATLAAITLLGLGAIGLWALGQRDAGAPHERLAMVAATLLPLATGWSRPIVFFRHPSVWFLFALVLAVSTKPRARLDHARLATMLVAASALLGFGMLGAGPPDHSKAGGGEPSRPAEHYVLDASLNSHPGARASGP